MAMNTINRTVSLAEMQANPQCYGRVSRFIYWDKLYGKMTSSTELLNNLTYKIISKSRCTKIRELNPSLAEYKSFIEIYLDEELGRDAAKEFVKCLFTIDSNIHKVDVIGVYEPTKYRTIVLVAFNIIGSDGTPIDIHEKASDFFVHLAIRGKEIDENVIDIMIGITLYNNNIFTGYPNYWIDKFDRFCEWNELDKDNYCPYWDIKKDKVAC